MNIITFLHQEYNETTTISEIKRVHNQVKTKNFIGVYAYMTQSGIVTFDLELEDNFWEETSSKWLVGIDYGRTHPQALRSMCSKKNSEVRIYDGKWVLNQTAFIPRRDFHAKMALLLNYDTDLFGMVVGSGNFTSNGLRKSIEAGATILTDELIQSFKKNIELIEALWKDATPANDILDKYEEKWNHSFGRQKFNNTSDNIQYDKPTIFWVEAGYVTKNRGKNKPGNQIDFPRGMSQYFGFDIINDRKPNTVIGKVCFETPDGRLVSNNLRLGHNMMEKITLPIPEAYGFDVYDGKILVFERSRDLFIMRALEFDDFETSFGHLLAEVNLMGSGRRYGHIL